MRVSSTFKFLLQSQVIQKTFYPLHLNNITPLDVLLKWEKLSVPYFQDFFALQLDLGSETEQSLVLNTLFS